MGPAVKVALLSDLHANLPALQAVVADMGPVDAILCAGDVVGYYPDADDVCALVRDLGARVVRGNHDAYVAGHRPPPAGKDREYRTAWTREALSPDHLRWLRDLPAELDARWDGIEATVRHASPWDEETYLYPSSPDLARIDLRAGQLLLLGHTHRPLSAVAGQGRVVNPGSVGQPRDWNPTASYAVLDTQTGQVDHHRVAWDVHGYQDRLRSLGWDPAVVDILGREAR
jgi:predicted phosphodiesterase